MEVFEVSVTHQDMINRMFGGFIFRRTTPEGICYIKIGEGKKRIINMHIPLALQIPRPDLHSK